MLDVLLSGRLVRAPESRTAKTGRTYVRALLSVATAGEEPTLASCTAFGDEACAALLALGKGDGVAVSGRAKVSTWTAADGGQRVGLDVVAELVLSAYHLRRKREAAQLARPAAAVHRSRARTAAAARNRGGRHLHPGTTGATRLRPISTTHPTTCEDTP